MRLADAYDAFLLDLDGVVYRGDQAIPAAGPAIAALREEGRRLVFLTNNSARTPAQVAGKLERLGIPARPEEVVTSAEATAELIASERDRPRTAYVIGQDGIRAALADAGIELLDGEPTEAGYVVVGWDGDVDYGKLRVASVLARAGARLVATNTDPAYPAPGRELWPGAGAIVAAVETASGARATVVGKPHSLLFRTALRSAGSDRALMIGDRVDTDILGAAGAGIDAAMVLSGAATAGDLLDHGAVPTAILDDLGGLLADRPRGRIRTVREPEMSAIRELTEAPEDAPAWGPEGVWVLDAPGEFLATASVEVRETTAYLRGVVVREDLRGLRLGQLLVAAAARDVRRRGATEVWLLTDSAEPFFKALGFESMDRATTPAWISSGPGEACPVAAVAMRRSLPQYST